MKWCVRIGLSLSLSLAAHSSGAQDTLIRKLATDWVGEARGEIARLNGLLFELDQEIAAQERNIGSAPVQDVATLERRNRELKRRLARQIQDDGLAADCSVLLDQNSSLSEVEALSACLKRGDVSSVMYGGYECSQLAWRVTPGGQITLSGHVSEESDLRDIALIYGDQTASDVEVKPYPVCKAIETLEAPGNSDDRPNIQMLEGQTEIFFGDSLAFSVTGPSYPAFIYVSYLQADGSVINLTPKLAPLRAQSKPRERLFFGDGRSGRRKFTASPPAGAEAIIAIASRSPIEILEKHESPRDGGYWEDARTWSKPMQTRRFLALLKEAVEEDLENGRYRYEIGSHIEYLDIKP